MMKNLNCPVLHALVVVPGVSAFSQALRSKTEPTNKKHLLYNLSLAY